MMKSSWTFKPCISQTVYFYTIVPKETLISIKLRLQWYIG